MSKKVISAVLILSLLIFSGCKMSDAEQEVQSGEIVVDDTVVQSERSDTENTQIGKLTAGAGGYSVTLADQTVKTLTFRKSEKLYDTYLDASKNEMRFDKSGDLVGYTAVRENANLEKPKSGITAEQADKIARKHIEDTYGDILRGYSLDDCSEEANEYDLLYVKCYGIDDFVKGETCLITVYKNGVVRRSSTLHVDEYVGFDETLLNGITEESLETYAQQQATTAYGDYLQECQVMGIWLQELEDGYALSVQAQVSYNDGGELLSVAEEYIYPLS